MAMPLNVAPARDSRELSKHFSETYFSLRLGLAVLAFAMPVVLYAWGKLGHGLDLQPSMSAYFWAAASDQCATFPMRTFFVGFLLAIGTGLYVYKGLTQLENWLLNAAAICATLVAIFPERLTLEEATSDARVQALFGSCPAVQQWASMPATPIHGIAAITLFVLLAIVAWACADKSLEYLPPDSRPERFRKTYRVIAMAMVAFPFAAVLVAFVFGMRDYTVFLIEAAGVWTFGAYWAVKSYELSLSQLENDPAKAVAHAASRPPEAR